MVNDMLGDSITRLYNASVSRKKEAELLYSKEVVNLLEVLKKNNFIGEYKVVNIEDSVFSVIKVVLIYDEKGNPKINSVKRISKPGCRIYCGHKDVKKVLRGRGVGVYSTSLGVLSDKEAYLKGVGGEYWCEIW